MPRGTSEVGIIFAAVLAVFIAVAVGKSWSADAWAALGTWTTAAVAAVAGFVALGQLGEARSLRREQAQPYVVAQIEEAIPGAMIFDLVVRNYGATAAFDVRLNIHPKPQRAIDRHRPAQSSEYTWLPESLALLVPGQEWRTLWDNHQRADSGLPDRHDVTISFRDSDEEHHEYQTVLDWGLIKNRNVVTVYGMHQAAQALREINKTVKEFKEPGGAKGVRVWSRDGRARDQRQHEWWEQRKAEREATEAAAADDDPNDAGGAAPPHDTV